MRARIRAAGVLIGALALAGCGAAEQGPGPQIVVTTNILGDVVGELAGGAAEVTTLMRPNADPHSFEISAREAAELRDADLVVANGLGLEEGLDRQLETAAADGARVFAAGEHVDTIDYAAAGTPDPHFWTDPHRMADVVEALETELAELDGIDTGRIADNADAYRAELDALDAGMTHAFGSIPAGRRALVTNHHVFGYLAERFGFRVIGAIIPSGTTLAAPSASDLRDLATAIREARVPAIFAESSQPDRLARVLAEEAGVQVEVVELFTESLSEPGEGAGSYLDMMRTNTERIAEGLSE